jgi:hypothetical protein
MITIRVEHRANGLSHAVVIDKGADGSEKHAGSFSMSHQDFESVFAKAASDAPGVFVETDGAGKPIRRSRKRTKAVTDPADAS